MSKLEVDIDTLQVAEMNDGGMGSHTFSTASEDSIFGGNVAEVIFKDIDGIEVNGALFIDQYGNPYELDMFKADNTKLEKWPNEKELQKDN